MGNYFINLTLKNTKGVAIIFTMKENFELEKNSQDKVIKFDLEEVFNGRQKHVECHEPGTLLS